MRVDALVLVAVKLTAVEWNRTLFAWKTVDTGEVCAICALVWHATIMQVTDSKYGRLGRKFYVERGARLVWL